MQEFHGRMRPCKSSEGTLGTGNRRTCSVPPWPPPYLKDTTMSASTSTQLRRCSLTTTLSAIIYACFFPALRLSGITVSTSSIRFAFGMPALTLFTIKIHYRQQLSASQTTQRRRVVTLPVTPHNLLFIVFTCALPLGLPTNAYILLA